MVNYLIPWLVFIIPIIGALLLPFISRFGNQIRDYTAIGISFLSAILALLMMPLAFSGETLHHQVSWIPSLNISAGVLADPLSVLLSNVVAWISLSIMVYSLGYMKHEENMTRYWFLMIFFIGSMQLIVISDNFLQLFFGWEGVGLCSYGLISFWNKDKKEDYVGTIGKTAWGIPLAYSPSHAGSKAFLMTRVGDVSFLIGILTLYHFSGTFGFVELANDYSWAVGLAQAGLLVPIAIFIFGGAIGKSAQFPLHEWLPDAMAGPTSVSALIHAATMVNAGVFLVARVGPLFWAASDVVNVTPFFETVAWIGAITAFLAASQAMVSKEIKKVLAYSTVSQIGYMMLALGVAGLTVDFLSGFVSGFFHLTSHAIFKAALFMGAGAIIHETHSKYMNDMGGLRGNMKLTFYAMLIAGGSLAGFPLLSGFWSKDAILAAILQIENSSIMVPLFVIAVVTAIMTAFYTFRMIGMVFFGKPSTHLKKISKAGNHIGDPSRIMFIPYGILALITLAIGLSGPLFEGFLADSLAHHLEHSFNIVVHEHGFSLNPIALGASIGALLIGSVLGYSFYIGRKYDPNNLISNSRSLSKLYNFLENRWYINSLYYIVFVNTPLRISKILHSYVETKIFDKISPTTSVIAIYFSNISHRFDSVVVDGIANGIASVSVIISKFSRKLQTGVAEQYVFAFIMGIIALIIAMNYI